MTSSGPSPCRTRAEREEPRRRARMTKRRRLSFPFSLRCVPLECRKGLRNSLKLSSRTTDVAPSTASSLNDRFSGSCPARVGRLGSDHRPAKRVYYAGRALESLPTPRNKGLKIHSRFSFAPSREAATIAPSSPEPSRVKRRGLIISLCAIHNSKL